MIFGTTEKLKFKKLKHRLRLAFWEVVGVLECLWLVTYSNAPDGDIGRLTNEEIAAALEWDGNADELVQALVDCRWLDQEPMPYRLIVHDWHVHCSSSHKSNYKRWSKLFAAEKLTRECPQEHPKDCPMDSPKEHLLTQPNLTQPSQPTSPIDPDFVNDALLEAGGRAGGNGFDSWGAVSKRLGSLNVSRHRECIAEAKGFGCTPELAMRIIDYALKNDYGAGAIVSRLSRAVPTMPLESGWPDKPKPVPEAAKPVPDKRAVLEQLRFEIIKSGQKSGKSRELIDAELIAAGLEP